MAHSDFAELSVDQLQSYYSDFHKDFHGWRPRGATPAEWRSRDFLVDRINSIHSALDAMKLTFEGRERLRAEGWQIDEPEPEIIDPLEYAAWSDYLDAQAYGAMA